MNLIEQIITLFKSKVLDAGGAEKSVYEYLQEGKVLKAVSMMQDRDDEVDNALREYNPELHEVMRRPNKFRKKMSPYISEKLPRNRQDYINEVELFFLLGNPIIWKKISGDDEAYKLFTDFLDEQFYHDNLCQAKRLAGAETESAKLYHITRKNGKINVKTVILSRSNGYKLRHLIDQYGNMQAFAYGYVLKEGGRNVQHWDFETSDFLFFCKSGIGGWEVTTYPNPTGKINVIYYQQRKAWHGVEQRLKRDEMLDSKTADTNNYFADPLAKASTDVIQSMTSPETIGGLIQTTGQNSVFEYINPPQSSESREAEKRSLNTSILFDTYTPDLSYDNLKGMGSLSGVAIKNSMTIGYIKRNRNIGVYKQLVRRDLHLMLEILVLLHPEKADDIRGLKIDFEFAEPFDSDNGENQSRIADLYQKGVVSLEEAVRQLAICDDVNSEIKRLKDAEKNNTEASKSEETNNNNNTKPVEIPIKEKN